MTYVDGLSATLDTIGRIQETFSSLPQAAGAGGFAGVLARVAALSGAGLGAPAGSASYGWSFEEGRPLRGTGTGSGGTGPGGTGLAGTGLYGTGLAGTGSGGTGFPGTAQLLAATGSATAGPAVPGSSASLGEQAVAEAEKFLGVPYLWGGTNPAVGVDCSGLVQDVYKALGISLPRTSQGQATAGQPVASLAEAQPGDLVFFPGSDGTASAPGHVGIYIGNGEMIDAPHAGTGVRIDPVGDPTEIRRVTGLAGTGTYASYETATPNAGESAGAAGNGWTSTGAPGTSGTVAGPGAGTAYQADIAAAAASNGVPEQLLSAVAETESNYNPGAVSGVGAEGLMQLMPSTASSLGVDPFDPSQAIPGAARLLASYYNKYGSWSLALAAYNAGPEAVAQYSGVPPYPETQAYVQEVLSRAGMGAP